MSLLLVVQAIHSSTFQPDGLNGNRDIDQLGRICRAVKVEDSSNPRQDRERLGRRCASCVKLSNGALVEASRLSNRISITGHCNVFVVWSISYEGCSKKAIHTFDDTRENTRVWRNIIELTLQGVNNWKGKKQNPDELAISDFAEDSQPALDSSGSGRLALNVRLPRSYLLHRSRFSQCDLYQFTRAISLMPSDLDRSSACAWTFVKSLNEKGRVEVVDVPATLGAIVDGRVFCVHRGLSPNLQRIDQTRSVDRKEEVPHDGSMCDLLWSDISGCGLSRDAGFLFSADITRIVAHSNAIDLIARAHQLAMEGYKLMFDRTIVTVWSAPNYCYRCGDVASILELDEYLAQEYKVFSHATVSYSLSSIPSSSSSHPPVLPSHFSMLAALSSTGNRLYRAISQI
ncbi:Metallo-dependent phosphatase-like protein [Coprinopsis sp. MPI-PUGE-AT-0042]|nr:Metallo-dependent phosphatase-like protein [Coprinopsis sp. MPI-PUGE-AT-0042]